MTLRFVMGVWVVPVLVVGSSLLAQQPAARTFELKAESPRFLELFENGSKLEKVASGFGFLEGPVWDERGFLYVSDEIQNKVSRVYPDGRIETVLEIGDPDGSTFDRHHRLITCASVLRGLIEIEPNGNYRVLADKYDGKRFNSPNDVVLGPDGALYFTDPTLDLPKGEKQEIPFQGVYRLGEDGSVRLLISDLTQPNGLAFSPDGKRLYVDDTRQRDIHVYDFSSGEVKNGRLFGKEEGPPRSGVPDGMRVDVKGNLYVTGPLGIWVWDPDGNHLGTIVMPEQPANLAWGDSDYQTLYMTAKTSVYRLRTKTKGFVPSSPAARESCRVENGEYAGWKAVIVANRWVKLALVPQLGGRLMQVTFGDHDYLFVNDQLKGKNFGVEASAAQKRWFNYGGDKIWPMPEGGDDERHWAAAEGSVLDAGAFTLEIVSQGTTCTVRMASPSDPQTGQQYTRDITIGSDSPAISFHAVMKNVSGYPQEWSEQSVSQYNTADPRNPSQPNPDLWGLTPVNPHSVFLNSYHVRTGSASPPGYAVRDGLFAVHSANAGGEVWIDSPGEWLAVVDGSTKYAMVERFRYQRSMEYPGKSSVIFFTTGNPSRRPAADSPRPQIHYMEAEVNSPLVRLDPGESYAMDTQWYPTRMGSNLRTATYAGVVGRPLAVTATTGGLTLSGEFGVFFPGRLEIRYYDARGLRLGTAIVQEVNPLEPVTLQQMLQAPADTVRVSVHVIDRLGSDRGPLGEASMAAP